MGRPTAMHAAAWPNGSLWQPTRPTVSHQQVPGAHLKIRAEQIRWLVPLRPTDLHCANAPARMQLGANPFCNANKNRPSKFVLVGTVNCGLSCISMQSLPVLSSCEQVVAAAKHVAISQEAVEKAASTGMSDSDLQKIAAAAGGFDESACPHALLSVAGPGHGAMLLTCLQNCTLWTGARLRVVPGQCRRAWSWTPSTSASGQASAPWQVCAGSHWHRLCCDARAMQSQASSTSTSLEASRSAARAHVGQPGHDYYPFEP